jgi:fucose permease
MEILAIYLILALLFFTIVCIIHNDQINEPSTALNSFEVVLLILFLSLLWPYIMVIRPLRIWWFNRGPKL